MLKKTITYKDLDGNTVTEDFYFNLSKAEIAEMELSMDGGMSAHLQRIVEEKNGAHIIETFKDIIRRSYGRRSEDGKSFLKKPEYFEAFVTTDAYSELFMEIVTDADAAAKFVVGIVPADLSESMDKGKPLIPELSERAPIAPPLPEKTEEPAWIRENREPTPDELQNMSPDELRAAFVRKAQG